MYKVKKIKNGYTIVENDTIIVNTYTNRKKANDVCRGLNLNKGFGGNTPHFFTVKVNITNSEEIDET
tara:strand:+ start:1463 stop:1663 length:201 start_codon:yes stop_codon:yes gene_type:complete